MTFSVKVDEAAATFFRKMLEREVQIKSFVDLFMKDIETNASSEDSFKTMQLWQGFLKASLGNISDLNKEELVDLGKAVRLSQVGSCSMVTQSLSCKYDVLKSDAEKPLYDAYSLFLPRMDKLV